MGTAAGSTLALALLVCGCVFAALAGPALSLHTRSQALQPDPGRPPEHHQDGPGQRRAGRSHRSRRPGGQILTRDTLAQATSQIAADLTSAPLPLAAGHWAGLTTNPLLVTAGAAASAQAGAPPQLEVSYRDPFTSHAQLVAGSYASGSAPPGAVAVAAAAPTAARFGLHPGSRLTLATSSGPATLYVTAIVRASATPARPSGSRTRPWPGRRWWLQTHRGPAVLGGRGHRGP